MDTQNKIPFAVKNAEICVYPKKEDRPVGVIKPTQKHTNIVREVVTDEEDLDGCDGLYTRRSDITLAIGTSDCAPVFFISEDQIGIMHCGWRGLTSGIVENMKDVFDMTKTTIYVAPFLHRFEIQKDFCFDALKARFGEQFFTYEDDKIYFEFKEALTQVIDHEVLWDSRNTQDDLSLPSHRRGIDYNFMTTIKRI